MSSITGLGVLKYASISGMVVSGSKIVYDLINKNSPSIILGVGLLLSVAGFLGSLYSNQSNSENKNNSENETYSHVPSESSKPKPVQADHKAQTASDPASDAQPGPVEREPSLDKSEHQNNAPANPVVESTQDNSGQQNAKAISNANTQLEKSPLVTKHKPQSSVTPQNVMFNDGKGNAFFFSREAIQKLLSTPEAQKFFSSPIRNPHFALVSQTRPLSYEDIQEFLISLGVISNQNQTPKEVANPFEYDRSQYDSSEDPWFDNPFKHNNEQYDPFEDPFDVSLMRNDEDNSFSSATPIPKVESTTSNEDSNISNQNSSDDNRNEYNPEELTPYSLATGHNDTSVVSESSDSTTSNTIITSSKVTTSQPSSSAVVLNLDPPENLLPKGLQKLYDSTLNSEVLQKLPKASENLPKINPEIIKLLAIEERGEAALQLYVYSRTLPAELQNGLILRDRLKNIKNIHLVFNSAGEICGKISIVEQFSRLGEPDYPIFEDYMQRNKHKPDLYSTVLNSAVTAKKNRENPNFIRAKVDLVRNGTAEAEKPKANSGFLSKFKQAFSLSKPAKQKAQPKFMPEPTLNKRVATYKVSVPLVHSVNESNIQEMLTVMRENPTTFEKVELVVKSGETGIANEIISKLLDA